MRVTRQANTKDGDREDAASCMIRATPRHAALLHAAPVGGTTDFMEKHAAGAGDLY